MARGPKNNLLAQQLKLALGNSALDPSKRDKRPNSSAPELEVPASRPTVEVSELRATKAFWVRQVGPKDQHWATVYLRPQGGVDLYFVRSNSFILDILGRPNLDATSAVAELLRNGFVKYDSPAQANWPPPKPPFFLDPELRTRVYSSPKSSWKYVSPDRLKKLSSQDLSGKSLGNQVSKTRDTGVHAQLPFCVADTAEFRKIGFNWAFATRSNSALSFDFGDGHLMQPSSLGQRTESEVVMGIDFGTSSTKVAIRDVDRQLTFPVYFPSASGVECQITPTALYSVNGIGSLGGVGAPIDDIKIRALKTDSDDRSLAICVAYLTLVIRFARGQLWKRYSSNFLRRDLKWRFHFGIPASDVRDFPVKDRYLAICRAAVLMSSSESDGIHLLQAADLYRHCATTKGAELAFAQADDGIRSTFYESGEYFLQEGIKIWPEVMAQTFGFLRSNLWNPQRMSRVMTVDIGAGTLDISLCEVSISLDGDREMVFTPLATFVDGLGLRNFVRHRYLSVFQACQSPVQRDDLSHWAESLSQVDWVNTRVPTELFGDCGFFPRLVTQGDSRPLDLAFKDQMGKMIWSSTVLPVFSGGSYAQSAELPVFLCGGGKSVDFYREFVTYYSREHGFRVRFDMKDVRSGDDFIDSDAAIFDRVSVAYGLAFPDLGRFIDDGFEAPKAKPALDLTPISPKWADGYVDKDMV
jgi:hypothetical protein